MIPVHLESERLLIRPFIEGDAQAMFELNSDKEVQKYTGDKLLESVEDAKNILVNVVLEDYKKYGYGRLAVIYKPDNKLIGFSGFKYISEASYTDIGYRFLTQYWGKGIATESSKMVLEYGFGQLNLNRIDGTVDVDNPASSIVLKKLGFVFEKMAPYPGEEDKPDLEWYYLTKEMYEKQ